MRFSLLNKYPDLWFPFIIRKSSRTGDSSPSSEPNFPNDSQIDTVVKSPIELVSVNKKKIIDSINHEKSDINHSIL